MTGSMRRAQGEGDGLETFPRRHPGFRGSERPGSSIPGTSPHRPLGLEVDAAATEWKASGVKITNKSQLAEYLEDVRWGGTSSALMERVLYDRPKNVPAFMIELLAKG